MAGRGSNGSFVKGRNLGFQPGHITNIRARITGIEFSSQRQIERLKDKMQWGKSMGKRNAILGALRP